MKLKALVFLIASLVVISACRDNEMENTPDEHLSHLKVTMHDDEGPYDAVFVEIIEARVHVTDVDDDDDADDDDDSDTSGWVILDINPGVYNLLELQNGVDTVIVNESILPPGKISQLRFILGTSNTVVVDSVAFPLTIPSAYTSGLKVNIHKTVEAGSTYELILDFDVNESIIVEGTTEYKLQPVIKVEALIEIN